MSTWPESAPPSRRMTRQAAEAAENLPQLPILKEHDEERTVALLFVTGDRGLAGAFNSQVLRAGLRTADDLIRLRGLGYQAFLVGERFMTSMDPGAALKELLAGVPCL